MSAERELKVVKSVRIWGSPLFEDSVMSEDIAGALLATNTASNCVILGYIEHGTGQHQSNTVYDPKGISPALTTITGGGTQQIKVLVKDEHD